MTDTLEPRMKTDDLAMSGKTEELVDILVDVQRRLRYTFDLVDVFDILRYTIRKCEVNGKGEDYVPILFENELRDFVMRKQINMRGRMNLCARSAV